MDSDSASANSAPPIDLGIPSLGMATAIGSGAAGIVYRAEQPAFNRSVAVKVLPFVAVDEMARNRFERECQAMGSVSDHPAIVTVYDAGFSLTGQAYIVMELMEGGSLQARLGVDGRLPWKEVVDIGVRLAGALAYAHSRGILHRDIKPDNILISKHGDIKLADFGIARIAGAMKTSTGIVAATPAHAPPEVLRGAAPTECADVYSLASTLWALLSGNPAFVGPNDTTIYPLLRRVEEDAVPDLRPLGVPDALCRVLERGMSKDPAARQVSAAAFATDLIAVREGEQTPARETVALEVPSPLTADSLPLRPPEQRRRAQARPRGRRPLAIVAALVAAAVTAVVILVAVSKAGGQPPASGTPTGSSTLPTTQTPSTSTQSPGQGAITDPSRVAKGTWTTAASLTVARWGHTATLLADGRILVVGGFGAGFRPLATCEIYDPASGRWSAAASLRTARGYHTATLLPDGRVLVAGGLAASATGAAEIYDPAANTWSSVGTLGTPRYIHGASLLKDGRVLVAGGLGPVGTHLRPIASAEVWSPSTGQWTAVASMGTARASPSLTALADGRAIVTGGQTVNSSYAVTSAELYDPGANRWEPAGELSAARSGAVGVPRLAGDGIDVLCGGAPGVDSWDGSGWSSPFDLETDRNDCAVAALLGGLVLVAGGSDTSNTVRATAEIVDPPKRASYSTASMSVARWVFTLTLMKSGEVMAVGGQSSTGGEGALSSTEIWTPGT